MKTFLTTAITALLTALTTWICIGSMNSSAPKVKEPLVQTFTTVPTFPSEVVSTLGAGDSFASTFCAALYRNGKDIGTALMYGSVNSSAVVSKFGATEGLLTFEQIEEKLKNNPDYTYLLG